MKKFSVLVSALLLGYLILGLSFTTYALPIISGGTGEIVEGTDDICYCEFGLTLKIDGIYNDQPFFVYALMMDGFYGDPLDDNHMVFQGISEGHPWVSWGGHDYLYDDIHGSADFTYSGYSLSGGRYYDVIFNRIEIAGTCDDLITGEHWEFDVIAESSPVPEPSTILLLASGLVCIAGFSTKFKGSPTDG